MHATTCTGTGHSQAKTCKRRPYLRVLSFRCHPHNRQHKRMDGLFLTSKPNASQKGHPLFFAMLALNFLFCVAWEDLGRK